MRILTLTTLYPNPLQPTRATYNRLQLREVARKHDVRVIAPVAWTHEMVHRWHGQYLPACRRVVLDDITVHHPCYYFVPKTLSWHGHCYWWSVRKVFREVVAEFHPDLIFAPWAYPDGWAAVRLGRQAGLPVVLKVLGSDVLLLPQHPQKKRGTVQALRHADAIVAVSQDLAHRMVDLGVASEKITVVYDGVDVNVFHPGLRDESRKRIGLTQNVPLVLFVGNLLPVKGLDYLLAACVRLAQDGLAFQCALIGQGPLRSSLEHEVARLGLGDKVRFVGTVPNEQLPDWYRAANVFVLPSRSEGVPNVLLEAAACGTPFVASRVGGIPEIAHLATSELVPCGDVRRLAEALKKFIQCPVSSVHNGLPVRTRTDSAEDLIEVLERAHQLGRGQNPIVNEVSAR